MSTPDALTPGHPPLTRDDLLATFEAGPKPREDWRIGVEHEKFAFHMADFRPLAHGGEDGIGALLTALKDRFGWDGVYEGDNIIALKRDGASISLEPGGQFELSGAPLKTIHETCAEVGTHLVEIKAVADPLRIGFLGLGFNPKWTRAEIQVMPKGRYDIMRAYMPTRGNLGLDMMLRTATVQVNLDFESEADMVRKFRLSLALQPIATALFANSPFTEGKPNGFLSYRAHIWTDTDPDRTGMLPFVFEDGFGFERYVDYALDVPMYFVARDGRYLDVAGQSFRDFMEGRLPALPGERPTLKDWEDHLTTIFPEVRLKTFLEMRGADGGPWGRLCALPALWVGLLYDSVALDEAEQLVAHWTAADRTHLHAQVPKLGLRAQVAGRSVQDVAKDLVAIAKRGLARRNCLSAAMVNEVGYISELEQIAAEGLTPADRLLQRYNNDWQQNIDHIFQDCLY